MKHISTWTGTVRTIAYVMKMNHLLNFVRAKKVDSQAKKIESEGCLRANLRVSELRCAQDRVLALQQESSYKTEINLLKAGKRVQDGPLKSLTPFLDKAGVMRVGGRLDKADFIPFNERHPIILPKMEVPTDSRKDVVETRDLTRKIIDWAHTSCLHGGERKTLAVLQQKFHIPNARNAIRFVIHRCVKCSILKAETYKQLMGALPKESTMPAPPFFHTTLDYAGPYNIQAGVRKSRRKDGGLSNSIHSKAWVSIFVCRLTGGCHLELVQNLTSNAFVDAFKRFVSTRGLPKTVLSDNATTFKKAVKMLKGDEQKAYEISMTAIKEAEKEIQAQYVFRMVEVFTSEEGIM